MEKTSTSSILSSSSNLFNKSLSSGSNSSNANNLNSNDSNRIITLSITKRETSGLGFLIRQRDEMPYFGVWEIIKNGAAECTGKIHKGDVILKVDNEDLSSVSYEKGLDILKSIKSGASVKLTIKTGVDSLETLKKTYGLMSPLQKLRKKFITCATNNSNNYEINGLPIEENLNLIGKRYENGKNNVNNNNNKPTDLVNSDTIVKNESNVKIQQGSNMVAPLIKINEADLIRSPEICRKQLNIKSALLKTDEAQNNSPTIKINAGSNIKETHEIKRNNFFNEELKGLANKTLDSNINDKNEISDLINSQKSTNFENKIEPALNNNENDLKIDQNLKFNDSLMRKNDISTSTTFLAGVNDKNIIYKNSTKNEPLNEEQLNTKNNQIQIIQDGDEICIHLGGIEILTNRKNDRSVISFSPHINNNNNNKKSDDEKKSSEKTPTSKETRMSVDSLQFTQLSINDSTKLNAELLKKIELTKMTSVEVQEPWQEAKETLPWLELKDIEDNENKNLENINEGEEAHDENIQEEIFDHIDDDDGEEFREEDSEHYAHQRLLDETLGDGTKPKCPIIIEESQLKKLLNKTKFVKLKYLQEDTIHLDLLHQKATPNSGCKANYCSGSVLSRPKPIIKDKATLIAEAMDFLEQFYASFKILGTDFHDKRKADILNMIETKGTYHLKETELSYAARTAWRNAPRCIGRNQWSRLQVFDARYVTNARGMFEAICKHLEYVYNGGEIRSAITVFRQRTKEGHDYRIWNGQFIGYAGYRIDEHTVIGDPSQISFTDLCIKLGWKPKYTEFDVLPLVLQANGRDPEIFELPKHLVIEADLIHPKYEWFKELGLKWYCVPAVSSMLLDAGGLVFTACPFSGWYMSTEIGRDLADTNRYNKLPIIADKMSLDTKNTHTLWRDKALVELNFAIIYSFMKKGITITDHFSASEAFKSHYEHEMQVRGGCPADWVWIVPPISSHLTSVFHLEMLNYTIKPAYDYQDNAWKAHVWQKKNTEEKLRKNKRKVNFSDIARAVKFSAKLMDKALAKRVKCTVLYASETGKSERFAKTLAEIFKHGFDAKFVNMRHYDPVDLAHETLLLIVTSTFGNGDAPENGEGIKKIITNLLKDHKHNMKKQKKTPESQSYYETIGPMANVRFSVFGLGNSSYPKFCAYAKFLDSAIHEMGGERVYKMECGDEMCGQEDSFKKWSFGVFKTATKTFCLDVDLGFIENLSDELAWSPQTVRLTLENREFPNLYESLSRLHQRDVLPTKLVAKKNLQTPTSGRVTLFAELDPQQFTTELSYRPGDHVGIFASNRKEYVDTILARVTNSPPPDRLVKVETLREKTTLFGLSKRWVVDDRFPVTTLRIALTHYFDIASTVSQNILMYFATQTSNEAEKATLELLAKNHLAYEEWRLKKMPNLLDVLEEFPNLRPNASLLMTQLPQLQPRFYSISSSPKMIKNNIHLTVGVVSWEPPGKPMRYGVCSKYLDDISIGSIVPTFVRKAPSFQLPTDESLPVIMVGAGTGIAPFRSFWQTRKANMAMKKCPKSKEPGPMVLYFGCRQPDVDELYKNEIDEMLSEKVLTAYYPAYSRHSNLKKTYVQDLIMANKKEVFEMIYLKKGHFYVCGDIKMAAEATKALELILQTEGNMSEDDVKAYKDDMKEKLRFHEDIFGNNMPSKQTP